MVDAPYLLRLAERLTTGLAALEPERRERHRRFFLSRQQEDGGFIGREGDSDLYYTSFAVRGLAMLGSLDEAACRQIAPWLQTFDMRRLGVIDLMNWLSVALAVQTFGGIDVLEGRGAGRPDEITDRLEATRTRDGGYAKSTEGAAGSTYHSFLVALTYELLGQTVPRPNALIQFLYDRQRDDGGFVEIAPMRKSGTNPTAAAVALLQMLGGLEEGLRDDVCAFLRDVRSDDGGFQANTRVPFADALSTFTALLTLQDIGRGDQIDGAGVASFIAGQLEFPTGGFRAAMWDEAADVEYSFYGLGVIALLRSEGVRSLPILVFLLFTFGNS